MPVIISMLRAVNVGGHNQIRMDALRTLYESLGFEDVQTYVQSGNVIFRARQKNLPALATKIQDAIEQAVGFRPAVLVRTTDEIRRAVVGNPFASRRNIEPGKLLMTFLAAEPGPESQLVLDGLKKHPEELHLKGRELYIYFPNGAGKSKLPWSSVEKLLKVQGTARNWTSVTKMLEIAEALEGSS
jgi:uncharacterized protein (DUF1697 family)